MKKKIRLSRKILRLFVLLLLFLITLPWIFQQNPEPLPGLHAKSAMLPVHQKSLQLLIDSTGWDTLAGKRVISQHIFDAMLENISQAEQFIYADFFLWNPWQGGGMETHRALSSELADALIKRKQEKPELMVLLLTDPINRIYGNHAPEIYNRMQEAGIQIVFTDLDSLADSNLLYSAPARFYGPKLSTLSPVNNWLEHPRWPNPFSSQGSKLSTKDMGRLLFFKANHRKLLITDAGASRPMQLIVSSFNPADGSSAHNNLGIKLEGVLAASALKSELDCVSWSAKPNNTLNASNYTVPTIIKHLKNKAEITLSAADGATSPIKGQWLTEGAIKDGIISLLQGASAEDQIRIGMFYLSDQDVVQAMKKAIASGARMQLILDANKDAFGRTKNGVPNRPVAAELQQFSKENKKSRFAIRWASTHGEQYHSKVMSIVNREGSNPRLICGSANWTRRNIADLNLEADLYLEGAQVVTQAFNAYFDTIWNNRDGLEYTVEYAAYAETGFAGWYKKILYRLQESLGAGTF